MKHHTSLHAMLGHSFPEALCLHGTIFNKDLTILVDGGSNHNFIQDRIVKFLGLNITHSNNFQVLVASDDRLQCHSHCPNVPIYLGTTKLFIDLYILPISGANVVLGIQWLKILGPIITDCKHLTMQFNWLGNTIHMQGPRDKDIKEISSRQLKRMQATKAIFAFYNLELTSSNQNSLPDFSTVPSNPHFIGTCF